MALKILMSAALLLCMAAVEAQQTNQSYMTHKNDITMSIQNEKVAAVLKAVEIYAEAGRQGSSEIGKQAFTEEATMSWVENGKITIVPITAFTM